MGKSLTEISRFLSLILRHKPETIGITLDRRGYADVKELVEKMNLRFDFSLDMLKKIVETDEKNRYSFNVDHTKIRANQGHSIDVDLGLTEVSPPDILYHGTAEKYVSSIYKNGLIPKSRQYVHLSSDLETAVKVGSRHGDVRVFLVHTKEMEEKGYQFYLSENKVWLTKEVPVQFLQMLNLEE